MSSRLTKLCVENSHSGDVYNITLDDSELSFPVLRQRVQTSSGISENDQILLAGPPFKRLDTHFDAVVTALRTNSGVVRIFLYNRSVFSGATEAPPCSRIGPESVLPSLMLMADEPAVVHGLRSSGDSRVAQFPEYERAAMRKLLDADSLVLTAF